MIISRIIGGLGNQMFQYAAGRALALARGQELLLDISGFAGYGLHQGYELQQVFHCPAAIASAVEVKNMLGWQASPGRMRLLARSALAPLRRREFVVEPHFHYWPGIAQVPAECYLSGYWQSEKYFLDQVENLREDFTFNTPLSGLNGELAGQISKVNAVSLHVRRGDYVKNPKTAATHGLCSLEYYQAAIRYVAGRVAQPYFFVFSDDLAWVQENLSLDFPCQFIDHNHGADSYNDMRLMSLCRHHIIANSSFSWWGAWLNRQPEKIVVSPKKWFAKAHDVQDLIPSGWVRI